MKSENLVMKIFVLQITLLFVGLVSWTFPNVLSGRTSGINLMIWVFNVFLAMYSLYKLIRKPERIDPKRFLIGVMFFTFCALITVGIICFMWIRRFPMDAGYLVTAIIALLMVISGIVTIRFNPSVKN